MVVAAVGETKDRDLTLIDTTASRHCNQGMEWQID
jgi:hypothetical protein